MEYESHAHWIQNILSICYFLQDSTKPLYFIYGLIIYFYFILVRQLLHDGQHATNDLRDLDNDDGLARYYISS
jgi:hypothetical protein